MRTDYGTRDTGWGQYDIQIPGHYLDQVAYLDIETRKVLAGPLGFGYRMKNGELLRQRWQAFLAGVAYRGYVTIVEYTDSERGFLTGVAEAISPADTVVYQASRQFDEMVLKGRFTNARRAHEDIPFYPVMPGAEDLTWDCRRYSARPARGYDCGSKDVPARWGQYDRERVLVHLLRDVVELILQAGEPDQACEEWCRQVLASFSFALKQIQEEENSGTG
jgi:hypothetical protein